jgi:hypothetical protein
MTDDGIEKIHYIHIPIRPKRRTEFRKDIDRIWTMDGFNGCFVGLDV